MTTLDDPQGRPTVADYARRLGARLFPVGRLDYDAEGALLLTDDGELAHKLLHPSFQVPRTYLAKVKGEPARGTWTSCGGACGSRTAWPRRSRATLFEKAEKNTWLKIVVAEGRQHLVKRLCAAVGHPVVRLFRPEFGGVTVEGLRPGQWRELGPEEVETMRGRWGCPRRRPATPRRSRFPARHGVTATAPPSRAPGARTEAGSGAPGGAGGTAGPRIGVSPAEAHPPRASGDGRAPAAPGARLEAVKRLAAAVLATAILACRPGGQDDLAWPIRPGARPRSRG